MHSHPPPIQDVNAVAAALADLLCAWANGDSPSLLVLAADHRPDVQRLTRALSDRLAVTVLPFDRLTDAAPHSAVLVLSLPPADGLAERAEKLAARADRLLLTDACWTAPAAADWLGSLAAAGLIYDPLGTESLPAALRAEGFFLLRRSHRPLTARLGFLTHALRQQQRTVAAHRLLAVEQNQRLAEVSLQALERHEEVQRLRARSGRLDRELAQVSRERSRVQSSPAFALLRKLQRVRARVAPPGTRRERLLEMVLGWLRILDQRGVGGLATHVRGELRWRAKALTVRLDSRRHYQIEPVTIEPPRPRPTVRRHQASVDVVVCVHNALEDVQRCLASVTQQTQPPYRLILVDDGSDAPTRRYLCAFAERHERVVLIRNQEARGYTVAANQGMQHSLSDPNPADFVVLLNSDTVVTEGWLDRLIACTQSDERIGLVGPLSNTASWQSVPQIAAGTDWADNPLPPGVDLHDWSAAIAEDSARLYPPMPLLNGFCLLVRRPVIEQIGLFDEENFGEGYGEENDYCLRARAAGWRLALADDAYVFHAQSRSYSHERRRQLSDRAGRILAQKHGAATVERSVAICRHDRVLEGIRARTAVLAERMDLRQRGRRRFEGRRLLFLLPADSPGGGANVVMDEGRAMQRMGVDVALVNLSAKRADFEASYPALDLPVHYVEPGDLPDIAADFDAVVATWHTTVDWMHSLPGLPRPPRLSYYVQDYEPHFFVEGSAEHRRAKASYTAIPGLRCFTKTGWNRDEVRAQVGVDCAVVGPSVAIDRVRPHPQGETLAHSGRVRVTAMVRPSSPRRSPELTMRLLRRLSHRFGDEVQITVFGVHPYDPGLASLPQDFHWRLAGVLDPLRVAALMAQTDVFVDFSTYQAMGLTALEAMAAGAAVIVPQAGGASSFARHGENALIVDTQSETACWEALVRLVVDETLRGYLQRNAIHDACRFFPERAAFRILETLFGAGQT